MGWRFNLQTTKCVEGPTLAPTQPEATKLATLLLLNPNPTGCLHLDFSESRDDVTVKREVLGSTQRRYIVSRNCSVHRHSVNSTPFAEGPQSRETGPVHLPIGPMFVDAPFVFSTHDDCLTDATFFSMDVGAASRAVRTFLSNGTLATSLSIEVIVEVPFDQLAR